MNMYRKSACYSCSSHLAQQGNSLIALPFIIVVAMVMVLFVVKINTAMSTKASLDRVSYALTSVVASSDFKYPSSPSSSLPKNAPVVTQTVADALLVIAKRQLDVQVSNSQRQVGVQVAQLQHIRLHPNKPHVTVVSSVFNSGTLCDVRTDIMAFKDLAPLGTTKGLNLGERADLFQVTVCLTGIPSFTAELGSVGIKDFSAGYFLSESLLIGRKFKAGGTQP